MPFNTKGLPHGTGKKPHKFVYTYRDIANITGLTINTVRQYAGNGKKHKFNPRSFQEVFNFLYEWMENANRHDGTIVFTQRHKNYPLVPSNHKIDTDKLPY